MVTEITWKTYCRATEIGGNALQQCERWPQSHTVIIL